MGGMSARLRFAIHCENGYSTWDMPAARHKAALLKSRSIGKGVAEPEGFEPSIPGKRYAALAKRCLQPLGHSSNRFDMPDAEARRKRQFAVADILSGIIGDSGEPWPAPKTLLREACEAGRLAPNQ